MLQGCGTTTDQLDDRPGNGGDATGGHGPAGGNGGAGAAAHGASAGAPMGDTGAGQSGSAPGGGRESAGGAGGSGASAGHGNAQGGRATAGRGGAGGTRSGGESGAGAGGDDTMNGGAGACSGGRVVTATPVIPTVELLVDTSSSMFETLPTTTWSVLYDALMNPDTGVVKPLAPKMRFGFLSYKGFQGTSETDPACALMTAVAPALDNYDAIDAVYTNVGESYDPAAPARWETPTDYAISYAANLLVNDTADIGPKYIVLATDGNPNTCVVTDPQCGQDRAIKATQDAYAAGIGLFVLGVGDIINQPNSGCPTSVRCGELHLQDLANAGVGAPVQPPPGCDDPSAGTCSAKYEACNDDALIASYTSGAADAGTPFAVDTSAADAATKLNAALSSLLSGAISCTIALDDPANTYSHLDVTVGATLREQGDPDGWVLESDGRHITLQGRACIDFKALEPLTLSAPCS